MKIIINDYENKVKSIFTSLESDRNRNNGKKMTAMVQKCIKQYWFTAVTQLYFLISFGIFLLLRIPALSFFLEIYFSLFTHKIHILINFFSLN